MAVSIRSRLLLLVFAALVPGLAGAVAATLWLTGRTLNADHPGGVASLPAEVLQVCAGALLLLGLTTVATVWVARSIGQSVISLKQVAVRMQAGLPVQRAATGLVECDAVVAALAEAARALQVEREKLERQGELAVQRTREAEQRSFHNQHVEALGRLTGGVAHDFNNLLGVISNSAHLIQRYADAPALHAPVAATLRAVDVGSQLTQSLLRIAGRQPVRPRALDLVRELPEMQELLQTVLGKRIAIAVAVAPQTLPVTADASEFELALVNLALNARDAMPDGGEVWLRAANARADDTLSLPNGHAAGPWVTISFTDEGSGVDAAAACRAFDPFFTTKEFGKGTGLGLSQVRGFCTQAGGVATLTSTPGLGTTVSLLLPASAGDAVDSPPAATLAPPAGGDLLGKRLLLVEDNAELATVTASLLETYGCSVRHASSPEAALQMLRTEPQVDAVLSDIVMPGEMDGLALAHTLRRERPSLPVVLITGYSSAAASVGDFVVLRKPCPQDDLVRALRDAIAATPEC
jgi:signal transduction histidine kinase